MFFLRSVLVWHKKNPEETAHPTNEKVSKRYSSLSKVKREDEVNTQDSIAKKWAEKDGKNSACILLKNQKKEWP